ncbi:hypothetical protein ACLB2K_046157 [Fragaria x ananassa]
MGLKLDMNMAYNQVEWDFVECHVPLSGVSSWATLVVKLHGYAGLRSKIKECRSIRAVPLEFRQVDPVEFGELVAGRGLNAEEGTRPSLHKLVGVWSRSPDEPKAGRNQSLSRLIRLAPWHGSAAWAKCGGRRARPVTIELLGLGQSSKCRNWTIYPLIAVIRHRSLNFAGVHWSWISYEGNYASHGVASLANLRVGRQRWANRPPPSILHVLSFDGLPYLSSLTLEAS